MGCPGFFPGDPRPAGDSDPLLRGGPESIASGRSHVINEAMSKALVTSRANKGGGGGGIIPAVCSAILPGVGQLVNGEADKAIGVFVVAAVSGASLIHAIPLLGPVAGLIYGATWLYGVADGFVHGRKNR